MSTSVQRKILRGAGKMLLFELLDRILGVTSMLILMHVLSPADFGIIAKAISASRRSRRRFIATACPGS